MSFARMHLGVLLFLVNATLVTGLCSTCLKGLCYTPGECIIGCVPGYVGEYCDEDCPTRCVNGECHVEKTSGTVTCTDGCEPGYCGTKCTDHCPGNCESCDRQCRSCNMTLCPERRYGADCSDVCSTRYEKCDRETGQCIRCRRGYYGDDCTMECTACFTREDDIRDNCLSGCDICQSKVSCLPGLYGNSCKRKCSTACTNSELGCNKATGECFDGCSPGYHGLNCTKVCDDRCRARTCDLKTAECVIGCVSGYHGPTCNYTCSENCNGRTCDQMTAECLAGCVSGFKGNNCSEESTNILPVLVVSLLIVVCLILGIVGILYLRRCNKKETETDNIGLMEQDIEDTTRHRIAALRSKTNADIEKLTANMIQVSAVDTVVGMLQRGSSWVTITGNAGDGKTTVGYMALKRLKGKFQVYAIDEPKEYRILDEIQENRVLLFDNIFGNFTSDQVIINTWKDVLSTIHKQFNRYEQQTKVIFLSRKNVLNESREYLGHLHGSFMNAETVVDLSSIKDEKERFEILKHQLKQQKVTIGSEVIKRVASMNIAHGFPFCSKLYALMRRDNDIEIEDFFFSPLEFLDVTTEHLYYSKCKDLFDLMIKNNGTYDAFSEDNDAKRQCLLKLEREQEGSYITLWKNGLCKFAHSSIYESVLSVICESDPLFCVKYASLSVLRQKITLTEEEHKSPTQININPVPAVVKALAGRFRPDILKGDYTFLGHRLCENKDFIKELLTSCGSQINALDKEGRTMLMTSIERRRESVIHTLIEYGADVNTTDQSGNTPLLVLCKQEDIDFEMIRLLIATGKVNCNIKDDRGMTALHYLCGRKNFTVEPTLLIVKEGRGDINQGDEHGMSPLHWLCRNRNVPIEDITKLIVDGRGDITKHDDFGQTSATVLDARNDDMNTFLTEPHDSNQAAKDDNKAKNRSDLWLTPTLDISFDDLVIKLPSGEKWIPVIGSVVKMCSGEVHAHLRVQDDGRILTNTGQSGTRPNQFWKFFGTYALPVQVLTATRYWELNSKIKWKGGKVASVIAIGVVEGLENCDKAEWISRLRGSVSLSVEGDCHRHQGSLCIQVWKRDQVFAADQVGECIILSTPEPGTHYNLTFGLVLDIVRGRVAFIDVENETVLCRIEQKFTQDVFPMFCMSPLNDRVVATMKLISGHEISITEKKKELIRQALLD